MSSPVRVLHVLSGLGRAGAESMVMNLYRDIDRTRLQFDFMVCSGGETKDSFADEILSLGGRIYTVPRFGLKTVFPFVRAWSEFFKTHGEYQIIHGHLRSSASIYLGIARRYGLVTIAHSHSTSSGKGLAALVKNLLQLPLRWTADYLIACSNAAGVWLFGKKAVRQDNYFVLNNALDADAFAFDAEKRRAARAVLGLEDAFVIGHIGSFIPVKNHAFIFKLLEAVSRKNGAAVLLLIGEGELRGNIEALARERGIRERLIFMGVRKDIPALLCAMDVFVLPSKWEGLPLTAVEAQASGLPCILSDVITTEAKISPLVSFLPLEAGVEAWADRILAVSKDNRRPNMRDAVRMAGYDSAETARRLQAFYLDVLAKRRKP